MNTYEGIYLCNFQWSSGNSCQGQLLTALIAGHFGNPLRVTLSDRGGFNMVYSRGVISSDSPNRWCTTVCQWKTSMGIRLGTAMVRLRESFHTMLLTISKSEPVSAGHFITNCHMQEFLAYVVGCWKDADPSTHAHTSTTSLKDIMIIEWASTVLPQLWWRRSWSGKVWACHYKDDHVTWRRYDSRMTLRLTFWMVNSK